jgi:hypothetical protein
LASSSRRPQPSGVKTHFSSTGRFGNRTNKA